MLVLDTNHFRELSNQTSVGDKLRGRLAAANQPVVTSVVTAEESLRGWLAKLASFRDVTEQIIAYRKLGDAIQMLSDFTLLQWDAESAARFQAFRKQGIRIGTMDLKIACITLEYDSTLLTRNTVDFSKVPGLRFANWLD